MRLLRIRSQIDRVLRSIVPIAALALMSVSVQAYPYNVVDLGTLGGSISSANGISQNGNITGYSTNAAGDSHGFFYSGGIMTEIGTFGGNSSEGRSVNDLGQVTGDSQVVGNYQHAFFYSGGSSLDLGTFPGGSVSVGVGINSSSQITGYSGGLRFGSHAFLWDGALFNDLGHLGGGGSSGFGINDAGHVTGDSFTATFADDVFLYTNGLMLDMGSLNGWGTSAGAAINNSDQIAGFATEPSTGYLHAFFYDGTQYTDLGSLGGNGILGLALNDNGDVVGRGDTPTEQHAFLYDGTLADLNTLIDPTSNWVLNEARGINNIGQIVGTGIHNGQQHAFLLIPTSPPAPRVQGISINPTSVYNTQSANATVTLTGPATTTAAPFAGGAPGAYVKLTVDIPGITHFFGPNVIPAPDGNTYLYFAPGSTTGSFIVQTSPISGSSDTATITAALGSSSKSAQLTITAAQLLSLTINPASVYTTQSTNGTVTLDNPAVPTAAPFAGGAPGAYVKLTVDIPGITHFFGPNVIFAPNGNIYVYFAPGSTTGSFIVQTDPIPSNITVTITADLDGIVQTAPLTITTTQLASLTINPTSIYTTQSTNGTITIDQPAVASPAPFAGGAPGTYVKLTVDITGFTHFFGPNVIFAPNGGTYLYFAPGSTTGSFIVQTDPIPVGVTVTITAKLKSVVLTAPLTITTAQIASLTINPTSIASTQSTNGTVTLDNPAVASPAPFAGGAPGAYVKLTVDIPGITHFFGPNVIFAPNGGTYLYFAPGSTTGSFIIQTDPIPVGVTVTITATLNSSVQTAPLTITTTQLTSLTINPPSVYNTDPSSGTVTLDSPAVATPAPFAGGAPGAYVKLTVDIAGITQFFGPSVVFAPNGNLYLYIAPGSTTGTFSIQTFPVPVGVTVTITANLKGSIQTAPLSVRRTKVVALDLTPSTVAAGTSSSAVVTLVGPAVSTPAPFAGGAPGAYVLLTSDAPGATQFSGGSVVFAPNGNLYLYIAPGSTTGSFIIQTNPAAPATTATITATLNGLSVPAALTITGSTASTLTVTFLGVAPSSVYNTDTATGTVVLSDVAVPAPAPFAGGAPGAYVLLTTDAPSATYFGGPNVIFAPNGNAYLYLAPGSITNTFTIQTAPVPASVTATITASLNSSTQQAPLSIRRTKVVALDLTPTSVPAGNSSSAVVTLVGPAVPAASPIAGQPAGAYVLLTSDAPGATLFTGANIRTAPNGDTYLYIIPGNNSGSFTILTNPTVSNTTATITATLNSIAVPATLTITSNLILTNLSPNNTVVGAPGATIVLTGNGFTPSSVVLLNGNPLMATFNNPTQLTVNIPAPLLASPTVWNVAVKRGSEVSNTLPFTVGIPNIVFGVISSVTRDAMTGNITVVAQLQNTGSADAQNVTVTSSKLGTPATITALPIGLGTIPVGASQPVTLVFPGSAGAPGSQPFLKIGGTFNGGGFNLSKRITLP